MKYVFLFTSNSDLDAQVDPAAAQANYAEIYQWFMSEHGDVQLLGGEELEGTATAKTVRSGGTTHDGPFMESKEVIGGYTVVEAPTMDAALACARTWPSLKFPGNAVEVRPLVDHSGDM